MPVCALKVLSVDAIVPPVHKVIPYFCVKIVSKDQLKLI